MNENLTAIKAAIAAFFTALGAFLGWQGVLFFVWVAAMLLDYLSGSLAAWLCGEWSSSVAREGLKHKGGMIFVVNGEVTLVPTTFEWAESIDVARAEAAQAKAEGIIRRESATATEIRLAQARLDRALVRKSVAGRSGSWVRGSNISVSDIQRD